MLRLPAAMGGTVQRDWDAWAFGRVKERTLSKFRAYCLTLYVPMYYRYLKSRVADPVHFRPDPDPANQNFEDRIRVLLALAKNKIKHR